MLIKYSLSALKLYCFYKDTPTTQTANQYNQNYRYHYQRIHSNIQQTLFLIFKNYLIIINII